jgi:thioredoxin 1
MASDLIKHTSDASFEADVLQADKPVLVDFWAKWCGPCVQMAPALDEVAAAYEGKVNIVKLDVDENQQIVGKLNIRAMPTLMLFNGGELLATEVGAKRKAELVSFIDRHVDQTA